MGQRRADEPGVQGAGEDHVIEKPRVPGQMPRIFAPL
ncbi:hypothetical protein GALL_493990 [mine drainage metagenome]|uniref:Uncharacterized protein n=1 Tax=mine drainage metagenome TaxID=410659 RepID=A0A1J5PUP5_9ZZZZ